MDFFKSMLASPSKTAAAPATPSVSVDTSDAGPSSLSPLNESRRVHKSRKSRTPSSVRKDKQRSERLADPARMTTSPLQEVVNDKSNASRRQSAPAKRAAMTPLPKANVKRSRHSTAAALHARNLLLQEEEDDSITTQSSEIVFASQPVSAPIASPEPTTSASKPRARGRAKRSSLLKTATEKEPTATPDTEAEPSQSISEVTREEGETAEPSDDAVADNKAVGAEEDDDDDVIDEEMFSFTSLLEHRWSGDEIEIKVNWHKSEPTWEPESSLHQDAPDALFAYWRAQGGRPENPRDAGLFDIFAIRKHTRNKMRLLVEWTGYPPEDNTWESRKMIEQAAPELLAEYWESVKPAPKRGKKN